MSIRIYWRILLFYSLFFYLSQLTLLPEYPLIACSELIWTWHMLLQLLSLSHSGSRKVTGLSVLTVRRVVKGSSHWSTIYSGFMFFFFRFFFFFLVYICRTICSSCMWLWLRLSIIWFDSCRCVLGQYTEPSVSQWWLHQHCMNVILLLMSRSVRCVASVHE